MSPKSRRRPPSPRIPSAPGARTRQDRSGPTPGSKPGPKTCQARTPAAAALAPGLHLVATPIGNLGDISARALAVIGAADVVACEDTRTTRKLLTAHGIAATLSAYHEHNAARARPRLLARMAAGGAVALVSDAGTPLVSDPGYKLVRAAIEAGLEVFAVPGPSAALAALMVSGLPSDRFLFAGFPPAKSEARRRALAEVSKVPASLIFFESARRLAETLDDMAAVLGPRPAAVAREITKLHEEVRRGDLAELADHYRAAGPPKGEIAIVVGPAPDPKAPEAAELDARLRAALDGGASLRDAVAALAAETKLPRQRVYARALALAGRGPNKNHE